mgnify:FL=1
MAQSRPRLERMLVEISLGISQNDSVLKPLSAAELAQWDSMAREIADIKAKGGEVEIPSEIPDIV